MLLSTRFATAFCLLLPTLSFGQATKQVTRTSQSPISKEVYSVLKTDKTVKHGTYTLYKGQQDKLAVKGHFSNGRKDSTWTTYGWDGRTIIARGAYLADQPAGIWEFYTSKGEPEQKYDYDKREMLFVRPGKNKSMSVTLLEPTATGQTSPEVAPVYIGGTSAIINNQMGMRYPAQAIRSGVSGTVQVAFVIAKDGTASNYRVTQGIGAGCDEEALRIVQNLSNGWIPAQAGGQPVAVECELPVKFGLQRPVTMPAK